MTMLQFPLRTPFPSLPTLNPPPTRCRLRPSPPYSTSIIAAAPVAKKGKDFMVDYLVDSLGFTRLEAISASSQVSHLKTLEKPKSFIDFFQKHGINKTQIRKIVSRKPRILLHNVNETLKPKIKFFLEEIGISPSDLVNFLVRNPDILTKGLDTCIKPTLIFLKDVMGSDELAAQTAIDISWLLYSPSSVKRMQQNVATLRKYGIKDEDIRKSIIKTPSHLMRDPKRIQDALNRHDKELRIPRGYRMFLYGIFTLARVDKETLQMKFEIFRSLGWTDLDVMKMSRSQPNCLTMSEDEIRRKLNFLMKELEYTPEYIASHACLMMYSMDKRIKPRYEVFKILKENKLVKNTPGFGTLVLVPESTFINRYLLRFKDELPDLLEIYQNSKKQ